MFSSTVMESKSAPPWKRMPTLRRMLASWRSPKPMMFWPSIQISPSLGCIRPMRFFRSTLLPPPLRPMMTSVSPLPTLMSTPRRISCAPMRFFNPRTAIMGARCCSLVAAGALLTSVIAIRPGK